MADWQSFAIEIPGKDLLEPVRSVLETLLIFLDVLKAILDTIKIFLVDFGNPIKALVEALIKLIEELLQALKVSGIQALFHVPDPIPDPNFNFQQGYDSFPKVFKASLFDSKDPNRPQPRPGSTTGGFVLLMVQADNVYSLLSKIKQLLAFFSRELLSQGYDAPQNFKAIPVGASGDPIFAVASVFSDGPIESIQLRWTQPTSQETPDPGFKDLLNRVAQEFIPASFLIERSTINPASTLIDLSEVSSDTSAGKVEQVIPTPVAGSSQVFNRRALLLDDTGDLFIKFSRYYVLGPTDVAGLVGQLGTFRYIDTDVEVDQVYYYRVRAFSGELNFNDATGQVNFGTPKALDNRADPVLIWPSSSSDPGDKVIMGKPSGTASIKIPPQIDDFDVLENLKRVFQAAITCDFHRELGFRDPDSDNNIGRSSLSKNASHVGDYDSESLLFQLEGAGTTLAEGIAALTGGTADIDYPWEEFSVRRQASILADNAASAFLEAGSDALTSFRSLMQTNDPSKPLDLDTLEIAVFALTDPDQEDQLTQALLFQDAYTQANFRTPLLAVVEFIKNYSSTGVPPDWIAVNPLRDIIPWSGQLIYDLLDKINALVDAFNGVVDEINTFIDLLERKIATLERMIEFLISILDLIESLQIGAFILNVPEAGGNVTDWANIVDTAGGAGPQRGPGGYSAGVALSYVAADITAFKTAFSIIFG